LENCALHPNDPFRGTIRDTTPLGDRERERGRKRERERERVNYKLCATQFI
jgi:hypothetical protein